MLGGVIFVDDALGFFKVGMSFVEYDDWMLAKVGLPESEDPPGPGCVEWAYAARLASIEWRFRW